MPSEFGDKTEAPTPRRIQEAREKGQVSKSMDLVAAAGLLAGLLVLNSYGESILRGLMDLMASSLQLDHAATGGAQALDETWRMALRNLSFILLPVFLILFVVSVVINIVQVGFVFSGQPMAFSLDKINPLNGFQRLFSGRTAVRMAMSLAKVAIIALVAYITIRNFLPELVGLASGMEYVQVIHKASQLVFLLGIRLAAVLLILALLDFGYQKFQMHQDLRMTKEEVKEELKRMEGDPLMRQRRRNVARQMAMHRMSQAVPKADVVITNPTELAIALQYDHSSMHAPKVVAKGAGYIAKRIREIAIENGVPILERKPLARALYKACEIGDYIPAELYKAVAEVLAYVFELAGKGYRTRRPAHAS